MSFILGFFIGMVSMFGILLILALIFEVPDKRRLLMILERILRKLEGEEQ